VFLTYYIYSKFGVALWTNIKLDEFGVGHQMGHQIRGWKKVFGVVIMMLLGILHRESRNPIEKDRRLSPVQFLKLAWRGMVWYLYVKDTEGLGFPHGLPC